jgi:hypothetical protein
MTYPLISSCENYYLLVKCEGIQVWGVMRSGMVDFTSVSEGTAISFFRVYFGDVV